VSATTAELQAGQEVRAANTLRARRIGIDAGPETIVFLREDNPVCRAEGFYAHTRVELSYVGRSVIATLHHVSAAFLQSGEMGLSDSAWARLGANDGDSVEVSHPRPVESLGSVRAKIYGSELDEHAFSSIVADVVEGRYSDLHIAAFLTACAARGLSHREVIGLTRAMIDAGERMDWGRTPISDKHSVGGLPGNRTTPIVVAIVAACGLVIPKTSSRAITSPAGTADTMETLAPVDLDVPAMRRVVEREGGCIVWGGAVRLSPADDVLIRVARPLDLDSEGQLVASVLSKKAAAGSTHLVLDLPVGPTAKLRTAEAAEALGLALAATARELGLATAIVTSDGSQPVGRGIGPALEARDVLQVLQGSSEAPADLRDRAVALAGALLELTGAAAAGYGLPHARATLDDGHAWRKFQRICEAQGGMRVPPTSNEQRPALAAHEGRVASIDNRRLAKIAKLAGAPDSKAAGVELKVRVGDSVRRGDPLYTLHAQTQGELEYAAAYAASQANVIQVDET
jgi:thymidine phosphorylase